jgi:SAM-dependent methyltransferase
MRRTYRTLYRLGITPWDTAGLPGPLIDIVEGRARMAPASAVDLGCGTGRQARYLDEHGWSVTAVDYTSGAIATARRADPDKRVLWLVADVTEPRSVDPDGRLAGTVSLLLDNGCLHGIPVRRRPGWAATVNTLAAPGAVLLIRAAPRQRHGIGPRGIDTDEIAVILADRWQPISVPEADWCSYALAPSKGRDQAAAGSRAR